MMALEFVRHTRFRALLAVLVAAAFALPGTARADGEAGIVIQNGDSVTTYCVAFQGDSISGDAALSAAGLSFGLVRGGALCSINDVGCFDAGSFQDCFCQCKGGADCTYWAFFEKPVGTASFFYSNNAVTGSTLRDGDMQAWKWGQGQPNAAPQPVNVDFASVCPARFQPTATPTQPAPTATPKSPPPTPTTAAGTTATTPGGDVSATVTNAIVSPSVAVTQNPFTPLPTGAPSVSVTIAGVSPTPSAGVPATAGPTDADDAGGGSNARTLAAFGVVAAALVGAVGGAAWWRRRHGA